MVLKFSLCHCSLGYVISVLYCFMLCYFVLVYFNIINCMLWYVMLLCFNLVHFLVYYFISF